MNICTHPFDIQKNLSLLDKRILEHVVEIPSLTDVTLRKKKKMKTRIDLTIERLSSNKRVEIRHRPWRVERIFDIIVSE